MSQYDSQNFLNEEIQQNALVEELFSLLVIYKFRKAAKCWYNYFYLFV